MGKAVTINDVAREAGVSKTTAVFVLNDRPGFSATEGTRLRVRNAAQKPGYRRSGLARALSTGRIYTVGVVLRIDSGPFYYSVYAKDVLAAMARACRSAGLRLTFIPFPAEGNLMVDEVVDHRVDGLVRRRSTRTPPGSPARSESERVRRCQTRVPPLRNDS